MMRLTIRASAIALVTAALALTSAAVRAQDAISFEDVLRQVETAQVELVRGRPEAFKALWSHRDDVTLVGGLGGEIERGWGGVARRLDWVSTQYSEGSRDHQEVSRVVGQDVAYVVQRETIRFRVRGQSREITQVLRATMVFRREHGAWRIVHRHADSQTMRAGPNDSAAATPNHSLDGLCANSVGAALRGRPNGLDNKKNGRPRRAAPTKCTRR